MISKKSKEIILVSACLLGLNCCYNGKNKFNRKITQLLEKFVFLPICPEQLGGLPTPRFPAEKRGSRVFNSQGQDLTEIYQKGAQEVIKIAKLMGIKKAILKERSPSCGVNWIYDGSFSKKLIRGEGILTNLLKKNKIQVISEEEFN